MGSPRRVHHQIHHPRSPPLTPGKTHALISSVHRRGATLLLPDGTEADVRIPGRLFLGWIPATGDRVVVDGAADKPGTIRLAGVEPRRNTLERATGDGGTQVIAANIDVALVFVSLRDPALRRGFVDRCLAAAAWHGIESLVAVNKIDLAAEGDDEVLHDIAQDCARAGAGCLGISCRDGSGTDALRRMLEGRTVVMSGPSGAGKTSLARLLGGRDDLLTGSVSLRTGKGRHTTVGARMIPLGGGTILIDTPGLRVFPIDQIPADRLHECFREFAPHSPFCRFRDCRHGAEPECGVRAAVERGEVSSVRYESYLELFAELSEA